MGLTGTVLPAHPQPKSDEIFSSWLCRIAQANGLKLHTLEVQLWGRDRQIWTRDIDRSIDDATLSTVAARCGTTLERARDTCLLSYEGKLFEKLNTSGNSGWILPAGIFHRKRTRMSMQFCPVCLSTDLTPYYRKSWRLASSTFCDVHDVMLHDCCPKCHVAVMFHRHELGDRWKSRVESFTICTSCGFDLKLSLTSKPPVLEAGVISALRTHLRGLDNGWIQSDSHSIQYSHLYFDALRNLIQKMRSTWTPNRLLKRVDQKFNLPTFLMSSHKTPFEFCGLMERHYLLQIATWYLMDWPTRFVQVFTEMKCRHSELMREFESAPYWFLDGVRVLEFKPTGPSEDERNAMRTLLQKTDDTSKHRLLRRAISRRLSNTPL